MDSEDKSALISDLITKVRSRNPESTKYKLLEIFVALGNQWHKYKEIELAAQEREISNKHLFEHIIELYRISGIIQTNFKEKPPVKETQFRIDPAYFASLQKAIQA